MGDLFIGVCVARVANGAQIAEVELNGVVNIFAKYDNKYYHARTSEFIRDKISFKIRGTKAKITIKDFSFFMNLADPIMLGFAEKVIYPAAFPGQI